MNESGRGWGFLQLDSPFMRFLGVMADLMILNILTLLLCIPVITAGAAFTAMHFVLLKIVRGEESYIARTFFRAFKENFRQATILWVGMLAIYGLLFVDWRILRMQGDEFPGILLILLVAALIVVYLISLYVFPVLSRYSNTLGGTVKTAFSMTVFGMLTLRTLAQGLLMFVPVLFLMAGGYSVDPIFLAFCFTAPGFLRAKMYSGLFRKYEEKAV